MTTLGYALRRLGVSILLPSSRSKLRACGSCSSPRCTQGRTRRTSARSSQRWSTPSRPAGTSWRGPSSTGVGDVAGTRGSRSTCCGRHTRSAPMSSTRTSSFPRACSPRSPAGHRSSSRRMGRTSRTPAAAVPSARRLSSPCAAPTPSSPCRPGCSAASSRSCPMPRRRAPVIDCGVDLEQFAAAERQRPERRWAGRRTEPASSASARSASGRTCSGSRVRSSNAARASSTFVGDGPLRSGARGPPEHPPRRLVDHARVAAWIAAADVVCQPSLAEPFGLSTLEGLASGRSVVATSVGGPPEFVPPGAGVLVDPLRRRAVRAGLDAAALLPRPNRRPGPPPRPTTSGAGGAGGGASGSCCSLSRSASLTSTSGRTVVLEPRLPRGLERGLVALAHLVERHALLEPVVARDQEMLDLRARASSGAAIEAQER